MPANLDFNSILADLTVFQREVGKIHASLTSPRQKEVLGEALQRVATARVEVETTYPAAITKIHQAARQAQSQAETSRAKAAELHKKFQAMAKQAAAPAAAAAAVPAAKKKPLEFDGQLGERLSEELTARFSKRLPADDQPTERDHEIWEDWSWQPGEN